MHATESIDTIEPTESRRVEQQMRDERASPQVCALVLFGGSVLCWGLVILLIRIIFRA